MKTDNNNITIKVSDNYVNIFKNLLFRIILNSEKNIIFEL